MDPLYRNPIWYALFYLDTSAQIEAELIKLLWQLVHDGSAVYADATVSVDYYRSTIAYEEGGAMLVFPSPVSLDASVGPTTFAAWDAHDVAVCARIYGVYVPLDGATEEDGDKLLAEILASEVGEDIGFSSAENTQTGIPGPTS